MDALPSGGAMIAVEADEDEVTALLPANGTVSIAAFNGPRAIVISGDHDETTVLAEKLPGRTKKLTVSHAFHSHHMDPMLAEFAATAKKLTYHPPAIPIVSTLTGKQDAAISTPEYWVDQVRQAVKFHQAVTHLDELGATTFIELGPDAILTAQAKPSVKAEFAPAMRRKQSEQATVLAALGTAYVNGHEPDWNTFYPGARTTDVPTYAFQRKRFWVDPSTGLGDVASAGLHRAEHPLLGATVHADNDSVLFTARLTSLPWPTGRAVLPSSALVELAIHAGDQVDCNRLQELHVHTEVALPAQLQVLVDAAEEDGSRTITVRSRPDEDGTWTSHATGVLTNTALAAPPQATTEWPPANAVADGTEDVWRDGDVRYATVRLPESVTGNGFALHPVLLEALLRPHVAGQPVEWSGVQLHATDATVLRVRLTPAEERGVAVHATDAAGQPVLTIDSVRSRPHDVRVPDAEVRQALLAVEWTPVTLPAPAEGRWAIIEDEIPYDADTVLFEPVRDGDLVAKTHDAAERTLDVLQRFANIDDEVRLVVLTRNAVHSGTIDPAAAAVWGLVRSAQNEYPGRILLVDTDLPAQEAMRAVLSAAAAGNEPQIAVRDGRAFVPRLTRSTPETEELRLRTDGTVLITGGTGALGKVVARHLVRHHGIRHLTLVSRSGHAPELVEELTQATVDVRACDTTDRTAVEALISSLDRPLRAVVHTAGVTEDGMIATMTAEQLHGVLRPKVDAAWFLHELTQQLDLDAFVLFSSMAATVGGPGQGNYAAANAFLDGLAQLRAARGLPAVSVEWGLWEEASAVSAHLTPVILARMAREGMRQIPTPLGTAILDAALASDRPVVLGQPFDVGNARRHAAQNAVPALMRKLLRTQNRRTAAAHESSGRALLDQLTGLDAEHRRQKVLELVLDTAAAVLGHDTPGSVTPGQEFGDLGFDSLTAVDLRGHLLAETGVELPVSLIYEHPTPDALADRLLGDLVGAHNQASTVDWQAEVALAEDIQATDVHINRDPGHVLLTGATGFMGSFVLRELLTTTNATVHCLVRAKTEDQAYEKIRSAAEYYRTGIELDRVRVVLGDLAEPGLGLHPDTADRLAHEIEAIFHIGAHVNWLYPYQQLKASNVGATEELLRIAARHRTVPLHYISSTGVYANVAEEGVRLAEDAPIGPPEHLTNGYRHTKWVCENVIGLARERGLPVTVYRVDVVTGDQTTGACQTQDFIWLSIRGMVEAQAWPDTLDSFFHPTPADYVAHAIVRLGLAVEGTGETYNLSNPARLTFAEVLDALRARGHRIDALPVKTWTRKVKADRHNAVLPLLDQFLGLAQWRGGVYPSIDTAKADAALGTTCPPAQGKLLETYLDFFTDVEYLPAP
ncbi:hypothetical protein BBK82_44735 [Lentzea guizhouensis]|uniref:Carrier domain-containing protein n=2 Tax=Lentzea guizhouensis TaxID=1586287 RepID=A0A1B2I0R7_9PSEU|nr:hypothetical protein BBK82_44735 [Lentzea guizhouensis]